MNYKQYIIPAMFILFDIISGVLKATYEGNLASTIMRKGLFNKLGEILALILGKLVEYASVQYQLGFSIPLYTAIAAYLILMETLSILENISAMNPAMGKFLSKFMKTREWEE